MAAEDIEQLQCITCGYDLRSLSADGVCPECGTAISRSLRGDQLTAADPNWLRTVALGQRMISIAITSLVISIVVSIILTLVYRSIMVETVFTVLITISLAVIPLALVAGAVGIFFLTAQELRESDRETMYSPRNVARISAAGAAAASFTVLFLHHTPMLAMFWYLADASFIVMAVLVTIACVALLKRLADLIRRVPDEALAVQIDSERRLLRWALPFASVYVLMFISPTLPGTMTLLMAPFACVGFIAAIGLLLATARLTGIMRQCAAHFRVCLVASEESTVLSQPN